MSKLYLSNKYSGVVSKSTLIQDMKDTEELETEVFEAIKMKGESWCNLFGGINNKDNCGKNCDFYNPKNKKSGCCKHRGNCYEKGKRVIIQSNGRIKK